jgi:hypothetical protein
LCCPATSGRRECWCSVASSHAREESAPLGAWLICRCQLPSRSSAYRLRRGVRARDGRERARLGLAQWQCSGFVIRWRPSRRVSIHPGKSRIIWLFWSRNRPLSVLVPSHATEFGSKFGSRRSGDVLRPPRRHPRMPGARGHPRRRRASSPPLSSPHSDPRFGCAPVTLWPQGRTRHRLPSECQRLTTDLGVRGSTPLARQDFQILSGGRENRVRIVSVVPMG